jgi:hypothetical protein
MQPPALLANEFAAVAAVVVAIKVLVVGHLAKE